MNISYVLVEPYKKSDNPDADLRKNENIKLRKERKHRKQSGLSIERYLNPNLTPVNLSIVMNRDDKDKVMIDEKVYPRQWDFTRRRVKNSHPDATAINSKLSRLELAVNNEYRGLREKGIRNPKRLLKNIKDFIRESHLPSKDIKDFATVYQEYIDARSSEVKPRTIQKYNTLLTRLEEFSKASGLELDLDMIGLPFYDKFKRFLLSMEGGRYGSITNDTVAKYMGNFKAFLRWSFERGYHSNNIYTYRDFKATQSTELDHIVLSLAELEQLYNHDFSDNPRLDRVRDIMCFLCYTGQRWGDVEAFNKKDIGDDGTWIFTQQKTNEKVRVPFVGFSLPAKRILIKYNYILPEISQQKFNKYIKDVGEEVGLDEEVTYKRRSGNKDIVEIRPKYKFMSSHMGRRTCATILLERGVPLVVVKKMTGHKDIKTLMKYENVPDEALVRYLKGVSPDQEEGLRVVG